MAALGKHHGITPELYKNGGCPELVSLKTCPSEGGCPENPGVLPGQRLNAGGNADGKLDTLASGVNSESAASPPVTIGSPVRTESPLERTSSPPEPVRMGSPPKPLRVGSPPESVRMASPRGHSCSTESLDSGPRPLASPGSRDSVRF